MNEKQLNYIREQQQNGIYVIPTVSMRKQINNSIIEELETIYNPDICGVETEYKASLNDISLPNDFLEDTNMVSVIRFYGSLALMIYLYLHERMCREGYKIKWNDIQIDVIKATLCGVYKADISIIDDIISEFIKLKLLYTITNGEEIYLTSCYQVYIFERVSAKRLRDRIYKKNSRASKKEDKLKIETTLPTFKEEAPTPTTIVCSKETVTAYFADDEAERVMKEMLQDEIPFT